ncbi:MAG: hypothetical protein R2747_14740 [Pyrinomonadaceae bacterium]
MRTVIEFSQFIQRADKEFGAELRGEIVFFLSKNPKAGKLLENFGGIRKLEWRQKGKNGKVHNIYFHPGTNNLPLVIISTFKKGEKLIFNKIIEILIHDKIGQMK